MSTEAASDDRRRMTSIFERYLTWWVALCIGGGILLGRIAPGTARALDGMVLRINGAPAVSIPIAVCLRSRSFFRHRVAAGRETAA